MNNNKSKDAKSIDAVIAWVDGKDPAHQTKFNNYLKTLDEKPRYANSNRFCETGEFEFCISSILKFTPWIRKIFVVTDNQTPTFMPLIQNSKYSDKVVIIDHKTIFNGYHKYLPTFNSLSIETVLWRIPDLSEQFIYFNDDFVLLKPVTPETFFNNGKIVVRGEWKKQNHKSLRKKISNYIDNNKCKYRENQSISAELAGFKNKYLRLPHNPHPILKSLLKEFFENNPDVFERNIKYPFRSKTQFLTQSLAAHLAFNNNKAIIDNKYKTIRLKLYKMSLPVLIIKLFTADCNKNIAFACLQDLDNVKVNIRNKIFNWLDKRIGKLKIILSL